MSAIAEAALSVVLDLIYALFLALPVMWLTAFLHGQGWPLTPLGYWASYVVAFLASWIIDGAGFSRRVLDEVKSS